MATARRGGVLHGHGQSAAAVGGGPQCARPQGPSPFACLFDQGAPAVLCGHGDLILI